MDHPKKLGTSLTQAASCSYLSFMRAFVDKTSKSKNAVQKPNKIQSQS